MHFKLEINEVLNYNIGIGPVLPYFWHCYCNKPLKVRKLWNVTEYANECGIFDLDSALYGADDRGR